MLLVELWIRGPWVIGDISVVRFVLEFRWRSRIVDVEPSSNFEHKKCRISLQWRHNGRDGVSNHQPHDYLPNRLFRRRSKKISVFRITGCCAGNSSVTGEFPHKEPVTRKMFPFDDVIMCWVLLQTTKNEIQRKLFEELAKYNETTLE